MKRIYSAVLIIVLVASVGCSFAIASANKASIFGGEKEFSLSATGTAYDRIGRRTVEVTLLLTGRINGPAKDNINLRVESGSVVVSSQTITVSKGSGLVNLKKENIHLELTTTQSIYGGNLSPWKLEGTAASQSQTQIAITLFGVLVKLPVTSVVDLTDLELQGMLTIL